MPLGPEVRPPRSAAELAAHVERRRALARLRRALRVTEGVEEIAAAADRFAREILGCAQLLVYCADQEDGDFPLVSPLPEGSAVPALIERSKAVLGALEVAGWIQSGELVAAVSRVTTSTVAAVALRASATQLIGVIFVVAEAFDAELLDELVFDVESVLAARFLTRLRAEELAVLEIQERELVGLLREVEERDAIIQRDLEEARDFQRQMLGAPPRVEGVEVEVVYQPLELVGGDLYAVSVDDERLRLFVADATGHGVRASLTTMFIKSGYEAVRRMAPDPAALLAALNDTIAKTYKSAEMLFSAACVDVDLATGRVLASSAAHPPVCVVRGGEASFIEAGGAFLGLRTGMRFATEETSVAPGDGIYLYTDGFVEARRKNEMFGDERFKSVVIDAHERGARAGEAVVEAVTVFLDGTPFDDDGTFIGVRYQGRPSVLDTPS